MKNFKIKKVNTYYYRITPLQTDPAKYKSELSKLTECFKFQKSKFQKTFQLYGNVNLMKTLHTKGDLVLGGFTFIQTENIPLSLNEETLEARVLDLDDVEGLGYACPFIFDTKTNILVVTSIKPGVNLSSIENFIYANYSDIERFEINHVVNHTLLDDFMNGRYDIQKVKIHYAVPDPAHNKIIDSKNSAIKKSAEAAKELNSGEALFEFRSSKHSILNYNNVIRSFKQLLGIKEGVDVRELKIWATSDDGPQELYDFVSQNIKSEIVIDIKRNGSFDISQAHEQMIENFNERKALLRTLYSNERKNS